VLGNLTINSSASVSPGASAAVPGTLTFTGTSAGTGTLNGGGEFDFNITSADTSSSGSSIGSAGTSWNLLALSNLTVNSTSGNQFVVVVSGSPSGFNPNQAYQWDFITAATGLPGGINANEFLLNTSGFGIATDGGTFSLATGTMPGGAGYVAVDFNPADLTAVPEPGSMILGALAALGMTSLGWRQRRRIKAGSVGNVASATL
jgi:hypothetical protein